MIVSKVGCKLSSGDIAGPYNFHEHFSNLTFGNLLKAVLLIVKTSAPVSIFNCLLRSQSACLLDYYSPQEIIICVLSLEIVGLYACCTVSAAHFIIEAHATVVFSFTTPNIFSWTMISHLFAFSTMSTVFGRWILSLSIGLGGTRGSMWKMNIFSKSLEIAPFWFIIQKLIITFQQLPYGIFLAFSKVSFGSIVVIGKDVSFWYPPPVYHISFLLSSLTFLQSGTVQW